LEYTIWYNISHFNVAFMGIPVSTYAVVTKVASLATTDDVTSRDDRINFYANGEKFIEIPSITAVLYNVWDRSIRAPYKE